MPTNSEITDIGSSMSSDPPADLEKNTIPQLSNGPPDPYFLRHGYQTDSQLEELRRRPRGRRVERYHRKQNKASKNLLLTLNQE
jgi:hypothetical protein